MDDPTRPTPPPIPPQPLPYALPPAAAFHGLRCPRCGMNAAYFQSFTMWGGVVGPKLLNHHKCSACKFGFNGKTGKSNRGPIWIYRLVMWSLALGVIYFMIWRNR